MQAKMKPDDIIKDSEIIGTVKLCLCDKLLESEKFESRTERQIIMLQWKDKYHLNQDRDNSAFYFVVELY